jgi:hypothetical protein
VADVAAIELTVPGLDRPDVQPRRRFADGKERATRAAVVALRLVTCMIAAGCADHLDRALFVEDVDATFGLARVDPDQSDAAAASSSSEPIVDDAGAMVNVEDGAPAASGPAVTVDAEPPPRSCQNVALFTEKVTPALVERCVRCHDGTKSKATKVLDLMTARDSSPPAQQRTCDELLKGALDTSERSPVFAEVNPSDTTTVHDFKYPSSMAYMAYRAAVLAWLETEPPMN